MKIPLLLTAALLGISVSHAETKAPAKPSSVVQEYARQGEWGVHYHTDDTGKYQKAFMIRYYESGSIVRMTLDKTKYHLDLAGDWKALGEAKKGDKVKVSLVLTEQKDLDPIEVEGTFIEEEGDKWVRFSEPLDEPGSLQDIAANGKKLTVTFPSKSKWTYDLKGSKAAWAKVTEAAEKLKK